MVKHLSYRLTIILITLTLFSCGGLRDLEEVDTAETTINLKIDESLKSYSGEMSFEFVNNSESALNSIGFYLLPNHTGGSLDIVCVKSDDIEFDYGVEGDICSINLKNELAIGDSCTIFLEFTGTIPQEITFPGIFYSFDDTVALGSFYPLPLPSNESGSFDLIEAPKNGDVVESILSRFSVTFEAPDDLDFAASGIVVKGNKSNGFRSFKVETGPVRDFFLIGSRKWEKISKNYNGIKITSWYPAGKMQQGIDAYYTSEYSIKIFERNFGKYPYSSFDVVSAPLGPRVAGMEYSGIVVLHEDFYTDENSNTLRWVLVHELGHQWFYNLVGNNPVLEPWIDESFTQYLTWLYFEEQFGSRSGDSVYSSFNNRWSRVKRKSMALNLAADEYHGKEYGAIIYGKGPLFLFTLKAEFGDELYNEFLRGLATDFRWKRINTRELQSYMYGYFGEKGDQLFRKWVYEEG